MKIFLDTEFFEYPPISVGQYGDFDSTPGANAVQLISIGAVREDGAEFYAENSEFEWGDIPEDHWLQENVRPHLWGRPPRDWEERSVSPWARAKTKGSIVGYFKPHVIAHTFRQFVAEPIRLRNHPEFWGYFCDYDWVALCGLYGRMVDLPPEFPMYCRDLKQEMDRIDVSGMNLPDQPENQHHALADARWIRDAYIYTRVWGTEEF